MQASSHASSPSSHAMLQSTRKLMQSSEVSCEHPRRKMKLIFHTEKLHLELCLTSIAPACLIHGTTRLLCRSLALKADTTVAMVAKKRNVNHPAILTLCFIHWSPLFANGWSEQREVRTHGQTHIQNRSRNPRAEPPLRNEDTSPPCLSHSGRDDRPS